MKKVAMFSVFLLLISGLAFANINKQTITLNYNNSINGLKIEVLWKPRVLMNGFVIGPAIIELTDEEHGGSSTVVSNSFSMEKNQVSEFIEWKEDGKVLEILRMNVELDYTYPEISTGQHEFGTTSEPFFFYDLNFDGKKELLISEMFTGQRWRTSFKAYELNGVEGHSVLENNFQ